MTDEMAEYIGWCLGRRPIYAYAWAGWFFAVLAILCSMLEPLRNRTGIAGRADVVLCCVGLLIHGGVLVAKFADPQRREWLFKKLSKERGAKIPEDVVLMVRGAPILGVAALVLYAVTQ